MDPLFFAGILAKTGDIPLSQISFSGELLNSFCKPEENLSDFHLPKETLTLIKEKLESSPFAYIEFSPLPICLCAASQKNSQDFFVWGPIRYRNFSFAESSLYKTLSDSGAFPFEPPLRYLDFMTAQIACFFNAVSINKKSPEEPVTQETVYRWIDKALSEISRQSLHQSSLRQTDTELDQRDLDYKIKIHEHDLKNHTFAEEQILWDLVKSGDIEAVRKNRIQPNLPHPLVIEKNPVKNEEYMAVSGITMMARSAIEAGVSSAESFFLSDLYLKKISECRSESQINALLDNALIDFTSLVKKKNESRSRNFYVEDCKTKISENIFQKITLNDLAGELNVGPAYLSRIFKKNEGITVTDYIHSQKIEWAKKMLKYSNREIADIAYFLQFNTQSYFGRVFKKETGLSPHSFRKKYHSSDKID